MGSPDRGSHLPDNSRRVGQGGFNLGSRIIIHPFLLPVRHLAREDRTPRRELPCKEPVSPAEPARPGATRDCPSGIKAMLRPFPAARSGHSTGGAHGKRAGCRDLKGLQPTENSLCGRANRAGPGRAGLRQGGAPRPPLRAGEEALLPAWRVSSARQAPGPRGPGSTSRCAAPGSPATAPIRSPAAWRRGQQLGSAPPARDPPPAAAPPLGAGPPPERGRGRGEERPRIPRRPPGSAPFSHPGVQPPETPRCPGPCTEASSGSVPEDPAPCPAPPGLPAVPPADRSRCWLAGPLPVASGRGGNGWTPVSPCLA